MATLRALLDQIETGVNHHATSDDSRYQIAVAKSWLDAFTAQYLFTKYTQGNANQVRRMFYDSELYEEVELTIQNGEAAVPPQPFTLPFDDGIYRIFTIDSNGVEQDARHIRPAQAKFEANLPYKKVAWYRIGDRVRFVNAGLLDKVKAHIIGGNPDTDGSLLDKKYPLPAEARVEVIAKTIEALMGQIAKPADTVNDEKDNAKL